jgi:hypothetical protein
MKNQYFGDNRDLFKYDFITEIMLSINSLKHFTFIPMLTENDKKNDGNMRDFETAKAGKKNDVLKACLKKYGENCDKNLRDFRNIRRYFESKQINLNIYKENSNECFEHRIRAEYFKIENLKKFLSNSLIFIDPDNGLQIKNTKSNKHLLYSEVKDLYEHMDDNSILMIYQHFPRARYKYPEYTPKGRSNELKEKVGMQYLPIHISDNEIIFFLLAKNDKMKNELAKVVAIYKETYEKLNVD